MLAKNDIIVTGCPTYTNYTWHTVLLLISLCLCLSASLVSWKVLVGCWSKRKRLTAIKRWTPHDGKHHKLELLALNQMWKGFMSWKLQHLAAVWSSQCLHTSVKGQIPLFCCIIVISYITVVNTVKSITPPPPNNTFVVLCFCVAHPKMRKHSRGLPLWLPLCLLAVYIVPKMKRQRPWLITLIFLYLLFGVGKKLNLIILTLEFKT